MNAADAIFVCSRTSEKNFGCSKTSFCYFFSFRSGSEGSQRNPQKLGQKKRSYVISIGNFSKRIEDLDFSDNINIETCQNLNIWARKE